jgi:hypothetical protein
MLGWELSPFPYDYHFLFENGKSKSPNHKKNFLFCFLKKRKMDNLDWVELKKHPEYEIAITSTSYIFRRKDGNGKRFTPFPSRVRLEKEIWCPLSRLVAEQFSPNPHNYPCVNHKSLFQTTGTIPDPRFGGRPRKVTDDILDYIDIRTLQTPCLASQSLIQEIRDRFRVNLSASTITAWKIYR